MSLSFLLAVAMLFQMAAPAAQSTTQPTTPPTKLPDIVAHRGASADAPENTLASFRLAWQQHADAIEGDYYLTVDGHIVVCHDDTLKRTGGVDRKIVDMTLAEVRKVDVGTWKDATFNTERVPTIEEVLALIPADKYALLEIKCGPEIVPTMKQAFATAGVKPSQVRIISFKADVIAAVKQAMPEVKAYWLTSYKQAEGETVKHPTIDEVLQTLGRIHADGLDTRADMDVINADFVAKLRAGGYEFHAWTVDDPIVAKQLIALGVDSITTNQPGQLRAALDAK